MKLIEKIAENANPPFDFTTTHVDSYIGSGHIFGGIHVNGKNGKTLGINNLGEKPGETFTQEYYQTVIFATDENGLISIYGGNLYTDENTILTVIREFIAENS